MDVEALKLQSRFAGLKVEGDEKPSNSKQKNKNTKKHDGQKKRRSKAKKKASQVSSAVSAEQWETWKKKDEEYVDCSFRSDLQEAITLSKMDYEENKEAYLKRKQEAENEKIKLNKIAKKKTVVSTKDKTVSGNNAKCQNGNINVVKDKIIKLDSPPAVLKKDVPKETVNNKPKDKSWDAEELTKAKYLSILEAKDKEIEELQLEVALLRSELFEVNSRNKKICSNRGQGEMNDKDEVLVEVDRLRAVQVELTAGIAALHCELEKERSKNADLRAKYKKKKVAVAGKEK